MTTGSAKVPTDEGGNASDSHTLMTPRSFATFAATMLLIDLVSVGYGTVDLMFMGAFGAVMVAGIGLGDLVTALYIAFFAGVVDVFAAKLSRAEGTGKSRQVFPKLFAALTLVSVVWTLAGVGLGALTPLLFMIVGSEPQVADVAESYLAIRMVGIPFTIALAAVATTLRIVGRKRSSFSIIFVGFGVNAVLNAVFIYSPLNMFTANPVTAVALSTVVTQGLSAVAGLIVVMRHMQYQGELTDSDRHKRVEWRYVAELMKTGSGVGLRQMNNYAAAVVPFMLITRLDVATIAAATVATRLWTIYCRVPQSTLGTAAVFIGYSRDRSMQQANFVAQRSLRYISWPSGAAAVLMMLSVPGLTYVLGGSEVNQYLVWMLTGAYLIAVPMYVLENLGAEILTLEEKSSWLALPSTLVTYLIVIPIAAIGVLVWDSALIAVLTAGLSSLILGCVYLFRCHQIGYSIFGASKGALSNG